MKRIFLVTNLLFCGLQSADLPDQPKKIDYAKLFRKSGQNDDPTSIYYYLEDKNSEELKRLINQAKEDQRFDILEKILDYAIRKGKRDAVNILLRNGAPIAENIIKGMVVFLLDYESLANPDAHQRYVWNMYWDVIHAIVRPGRKGEFDTLVKYMVTKGNRTFLNALLIIAIDFANIPYVEQLIGYRAFMARLTDLQDAINTLTGMMNNSNDPEYKKRIQTIINTLMEGYERYMTKVENEERWGQ